MAPNRITRALGTLLHRLYLRVLRRRRRAVAAGEMGRVEARRIRRQAREMLGLVSDLERRADDVLRGDGGQAVELRPVELPRDATLFHRPEMFMRPWRSSGLARPGTGAKLGADVTLHHDFAEPEFSVRQRPNPPDADAPFSVELEAYELSGTFLSFALALPASEARQTRKEDLIRLTFDMEMDLPLEIFARLNLRHGPNVEQIVREVDLNGREAFVEFDVFYSGFEPSRGKDIWIDLIFQTPSLNTIRLRDLTVLRRPRLSL
ncbi:MAG: DUF6478 family protein [Pseudomonadota bacterium]